MLNTTTDVALVKFVTQFICLHDYDLLMCWVVQLSECVLEGEKHTWVFVWQQRD